MDDALRLQWTFGFNNKITGGVHNLSDANRIALFYVRCAASFSFLNSFGNKSRACSRAGYIRLRCQFF